MEQCDDVSAVRVADTVSFVVVCCFSDLVRALQSLYCFDDQASLSKCAPAIQAPVSIRLPVLFAVCKEVRSAFLSELCQSINASSGCLFVETGDELVHSELPEDIANSVRMPFQLSPELHDCQRLCRCFE